MKKAAITVSSLLLAGTLILGACQSSGGKQSDDPETPSAQTESGNTESQSTDTSGSNYYWDTHGSSDMTWQGSDEYKNYVSVQKNEATIASDDSGSPIASMKGIFPGCSNWAMDKYNGSPYTSWHFESYYDFGEVSPDDEITVWGNFDNYAAMTAEDNLSLYLREKSSGKYNDAVEGTVVNSALLTKDVNGHTIKYVRTQYRAVKTLSDGTEITKYCQLFYAYLPFTAPNGDTAYVVAEVNDFRTDPEKLMDDSVIDLIFENVTVSE